MQRLAVDKYVVVPHIEEFVLNQEKYPELFTGGWQIVGRYGTVLQPMRTVRSNQ